MSNSRNQDQLFRVDHLKVDIEERAVRGASIMFVAQAIKLALQLGALAILARLLEPTDFGLVAMVTVFTNLGLQMMEGGLAMAVIQREQITHAQVSNLFWVNSALGAGLCLLGIVISPLVAGIYAEPRLMPIMAVMSLTFLIGALSVQHDALLRRQMRFTAISIIDIVSMTAGVVAGIASAIGGLQYWALVISPIAMLLTKTTMRWISARWLPSAISRSSDVRPLLDFGANLTGANFIGYMATNVTAFAVGYIGGPQALGFYNRASILTAIPSSQLLPPVMSVMQSMLTRVKDEPEKLKNAARSLMTKIAMATMLVTITMFVTADWIVELFLGDGWTGAIEIFRVLAISTIVTPITTFTAVIMVAVGEARALMRWKAITLAILAVSIGFGMFWGVMGVVLAHCVSGIFIRMPGFLVYSSRYQPITAKDFFKSLYPVFLSSMLTVSVAMVVRGFLVFQDELISIFMYSLIIFVLYFLSLSMFSGTRLEIEKIIFLFKNIFLKYL
ncbi:lipopolysaccharide biosynthesis protein [Marinobacter salinexigens]|uniref:Lipopolysaccharide biosynthesis protein n=1 Tax=Marinobacter salinexigens TaxID=2919747 RepID=A0A5B0VIY1_9GAMM|nr:lipopolysaccharide biosynthesis protein [Marinobacter salinexigens]KAA1174657.1 lipopolysaccharide biosynthesis protein [Marinobacter salinexigens]